MRRLSKKILLELREYFVGTTLRDIEIEFGSADIQRDTEFEPPESGQRRCMVEQYYKTLDLSSWSDVQKILQVMEVVLRRLEQRSDEWGDKKHAEFVFYLKRDGFVIQDGRILSPTDGASTAAISSLALKLDAHNLKDQLRRIEASLEEDPRLAIGTSKELVETTCKTILSERGISFSANSDILELVKIARRELRLTPQDIPDNAKASETIKRLLSNLGSVVQGLAELRNLYGTGHGPNGRARGLEVRHARLAAGAANALSTFLLETHQAREVAQEARP